MFVFLKLPGFIPGKQQTKLDRLEDVIATVPGT
jgi:hypothetical protein